MRLANKVAVITGAGHGLGRNDAVRMAAEGAKIVVSDVNPALGEETVSLIRKAGGQATFVRCDVTKSAEVQALMQSAVSIYGKLDVLVNNAGVIYIGRLVDVPEEEFDRVIDVNLKGVFLCMKHAIPIMIAQGGGSIINVSSVSGLRGAPTLAAYNASKGGVTLLTFNAAAAYSGQGVRCNCICPNTIDETGMHQQLRDSVAARSPQPINVPAAALASNPPMGRLGTPDEVADLIIFLASDESTYISGAAIPIDGALISRF